MSVYQLLQTLAEHHHCPSVSSLYTTLLAARPLTENEHCAQQLLFRSFALRQNNRPQAAERLEQIYEWLHQPSTETELRWAVTRLCLTLMPHDDFGDATSIFSSVLQTGFSHRPQPSMLCVPREPNLLPQHRYPEFSHDYLSGRSSLPLNSCLLETGSHWSLTQSNGLYTNFVRQTDNHVAVSPKVEAIHSIWDLPPLPIEPIVLLPRSALPIASSTSDQLDARCPSPHAKPDHLPAQSMPKLYLSEMPAPLWRECLSHINDHISFNSASANGTVDLTSMEVLRDVVHVLTGVPSALFIWNSDDGEFSLSPSYDDTQQSDLHLLHEFASYGTFYRRLQEFCNDHLVRQELHLSQLGVRFALAQAIADHLHAYSQAILRLYPTHQMRTSDQPPPQLLTVSFRVRFAALQLWTIMRMCSMEGFRESIVMRTSSPANNMLSSLATSHFDSDVALLSRLYEAARSAPARDAECLTHLMLSAMQPYLERLSKWVFHGDASSGIVAADLNIAQSVSALYWNHAFSCSSELTPNTPFTLLPEFLWPIGEDVLDAGRSIHFLRRVDPQHPLCVSTESTLPPLKIVSKNSTLLELQNAHRAFLETVANRLQARTRQAADAQLRTVEAQQQLARVAHDTLQRKLEAHRTKLADHNLPQSVEKQQDRGGEQRFIVMETSPVVGVIHSELDVNDNALEETASSNSNEDSTPIRLQESSTWMASDALFQQFDALPAKKQVSVEHHRVSTFHETDLALPIDILLKRCVLDFIVEFCQTAAFACVSIMRTEFNLIRHLERLRDYVFMHNGVFAKLLTEQLVVLDDEALSLVFHQSKLTQSLLIALEGSRGAGVADEGFISLAVCPEAEKGTFEHIKVVYQAEWPMTLLFDESIMEKYNHIFRFLLRLRASALALASVRELLNERREERIERLRPLEMLRREMEHVLQVLHGYILHQVLNVSWNELGIALEKAVGISGLRDAHLTYLDVIIYRCLLNKKADAVMRILSHILLVIIKFRELVAKASNPVWSDTQYASFVGVRDTFKKSIGFLYAILAKLVQHGYQSEHLEDLLMRLNFNYFYGGQ